MSAVSYPWTIAHAAARRPSATASGLPSPTTKNINGCCMEFASNPSPELCPATTLLSMTPPPRTRDRKKDFAHPYGRNTRSYPFAGESA